MSTTTAEIRNQATDSDNNPKMEKLQIKNLQSFASTADKLLMATGILCGILYSAKYLALAFTMGELGNVLSSISMDKLYSTIKDSQNYTQNSALVRHHLTAFQQTFGLDADLASVIQHAVFKMVFIVGMTAIGTLLCFFGMTVTLEKAAANQINRIRLAFVSALLRQDIAWFDHCKTSKFISQTENDFKLYQDGIGFKIGHLTCYVSCYVVPFCYCLIVQWRLALVGYSTAPLFIITYKLTTLIQKHFSAKESQSFSNAGIIAEDVLTSFKTVIGFNGQVTEIQRYSKHLAEGRKYGIIKSFLTALCHSLFFLIIVGTHVISGWYAHYLYQTIPGYALLKNAVADLIALLVLINIGGMRLAEIFGLADYVSMAISSGKRILDVINRIPEYDCDTNGDNKDLISIDKIEFEHVDFSYFNRKDAPVLQNFSMQVNKGECIALVGHSGCGKSTIINLLYRFYDPVKGSIKINGLNLKNVNLGWLRSQIGVVSQEPVLFPTTIYENIRYGFPNASLEDIELAAKMANAHDFIMDLPEKYQTKVGDRGTQLSGGQKQRIAIARALVRKPSILLLDEATSALDSQSEKIVQEAIDTASVGRTSLVIAHRLSTIKNAHKIVVFNEGKVVECGNHDSLMEARSHYYELVKAQMDCIAEENTATIIENKSSQVAVNEVEEITMEPKKTKVNGLNAKFITVQRARRLSVELKKVAKGQLSLRKCSIVRLFLVGGWGPVYIYLGIVAAVIQGVSFMEMFVNVIPYINIIFENHDPDNLRGLYVYINGLVRFGLLLIVSDFVMVLFSGLAGAVIAKRLRDKLFFSLMRQDVSWYEKSHSSVGNLCLILSHDVENLKTTLSSHLNTIITVMAQTVTGLVVLYQIAWHYGVLTMVGFALAFLLTVYTKQRIYTRVLKEVEMMKSANETLRDIVMNVRTIRFLNAEVEFEKLYSKYSKVKSSRKDKVNRYFLAALSSLLDSISQISIVALGLMTPTMFFHDIVVLMNFFKAFSIAGMANMFGRSISVMPNIISAMASIEKIFQIIESEPEVDTFSQEGTTLNEDKPANVELQNVSFSYPARPECLALNQFDIDISSYQTVAIVGGSGSGKSTCIQLAARFYEPQSGSVLVCNESVKTVRLDSLRQMMAIVQQEPMVFNRSIAENIAYGDITRVVPMEEIVEAANVARVHDFISSLPQGYDTVVGSRGTQLSGGQKQRIAIARALIRKPRLLFLDEATSALDSQTDKELQLTLRQNKNKSTIVIIAHRLSTITDADKIFVINQGKVVESGSHAELMEMKGAYMALYTNQINN